MARPSRHAPGSSDRRGADGKRPANGRRAAANSSPLTTNITAACAPAPLDDDPEHRELLLPRRKRPGVEEQALGQGARLHGDPAELDGNRLELRDRDGLRRLAGLGIPTRAIPMRPEPGLADLRALWQVRRYLREHGPFDVIHGHSSKGGALARLAAPP